MTITAKVVADSIGPAGVRLTTFQLRYPRHIHSQVMTHRVFSRSAASSRARPVLRQIRDISNDPVFPMEWSQNGKGMSPTVSLDEKSANKAKSIYTEILEYLIAKSEELESLKLHKQYANRVLEPFAHIDVVLTGTDFTNFFNLRIDDAAQLEIQQLALSMREALDNSVPAELMPEEWHIPYIMEDEMYLHLDSRRKIGVARSARVSYNAFTEDRPSNMNEDIALCNRLLTENHMSPFEHVAMCLSAPLQIANFRGWLQYRQVLDKMSSETL